MTSDLCNDDVVVCVVTSPQIMTTQSAACGGGGSRLATSTATVELGRRLLLAARAGDTALVLELMARGAPFTTDWLGTSPLHLAAGNGHADACGVLLRAGFSCEARSKVARTPLHGAAAGGHVRAARALLAAGAAPDARDMLRMTPLHWAAQRGHAQVARELLARGADPGARSKFRKRPRDLAQAIGRPDIVRLLDDAAAAAETKPAEPRADNPAEEPRPSAFKRDDLIKIIENAMKDRDQTDVPTTEPQVLFETMTKVQAEKPTKPPAPLEGVDSSSEQCPSEGSAGASTTEGASAEGASAAGAALLRQHGITLLPADDGSTVLTALQSGRTVVLSDAGKLMLKESVGGPAGAGGGAGGPAGGAPRAGVVLTATAVRSPPRGVKVFTLNNKLLTLPRPPDPAAQVKFVQLPPDVKIVSPSKLSAAKPKAKPARAPPSVKIIMNKSNFNKLIANGAAKSTVAQNGVEVRSQLLAAQRTIAELRAQLLACRERLARYEDPPPAAH